eukprot:TRINITY_DN9277_c0_g1_i1.p1 TRINITY_DN9277_c0_g1~~TRINITY_DN9277_c0_g1_i1.p1  ORF type:complete len:830 (+),score=220.63 TRINITY_DN9277_c0_g1_i1:278-2767(+)
MSDIKKKSSETADEKKKAKLEKKEKKKEAKQRKEEEKRNASTLPDKKSRGGPRFSLFVHKDKELTTRDDQQETVMVRSSSAPPSPTVPHLNALKSKKKSGSKISNLLTRRPKETEDCPGSSPQAPSSPTSPAASPPRLVGGEINADMDKQKVKMRLSRFFTSRPTKQELVEKKILYKDFQPPTEVTNVPLRYEGIKNITQYMIQKGALNREGIFRVPGNALIVREIWKRLAENPPPDFVKETLPKEQGPNEFAGALKLYLREAPEPAVPFGQYARFMECLTKPDPPQKAQALKVAVRELPEENFNIMKTLFVFLKNVSNLAVRNKMDVKNIGIVFGPSVVRKEIEDNGFMELRSAGFQAEIVCLMINFITEIFGEEVADLIKVGLDEPDVQAAIAAQQQQKQAAAAQPQQLVISQTGGVPNSPQFPTILTTTITDSKTETPAKTTTTMVIPTGGFANTTPIVSPIPQKRIIKIVRSPTLNQNSTVVPKAAPSAPSPTSPRGTSGSLPNMGSHSPSSPRAPITTSPSPSSPRSITLSSSPSPSSPRAQTISGASSPRVISPPVRVSPSPPKRAIESSPSPPPITTPVDTTDTAAVVANSVVADVDSAPQTSDDVKATQPSKATPIKPPRKKSSKSSQSEAEPASPTKKRGSRTKKSGSRVSTKESLTDVASISSSTDNTTSESEASQESIPLANDKDHTQEATPSSHKKGSRTKKHGSRVSSKKSSAEVAPNSMTTTDNHTAELESSQESVAPLADDQNNAQESSHKEYTQTEQQTQSTEQQEAQTTNNDETEEGDEPPKVHTDCNTTADSSPIPVHLEQAVVDSSIVEV